MSNSPQQAPALQDEGFRCLKAQISAQRRLLNRVADLPITAVPFLWTAYLVRRITPEQMTKHPFRYLAIFNVSAFAGVFIVTEFHSLLRSREFDDDVVRRVHDAQTYSSF